jgi:hypothetical protein
MSDTAVLSKVIYSTSEIPIRTVDEHHHDKKSVNHQSKTNYSNDHQQQQQQQQPQLQHQHQHQHQHHHHHQQQQQQQHRRIIRQPKSSIFSDQLSKTPFTIFHVMYDLGCFEWKPPPLGKRPKYRKVCDATVQEMKSYLIDEDISPPSLVNIEHFVQHQLPHQLRKPNQHGRKVGLFFQNKYPYDTPSLMSVHVAMSRLQKTLASSKSVQPLCVDEEIHFSLGGSALDMLARSRCTISARPNTTAIHEYKQKQNKKKSRIYRNPDHDNPYIVYRLPTSKVIVIKKQSFYKCNLDDDGFQVERLLTKEPDDDHLMENQNNIDENINAQITDKIFLAHVQIMLVGNKYRVLLAAETDASTTIDQFPWEKNNMPDEHLDDVGRIYVEIKSSQPKNWQTAVMFQMISSGSSALCAVAKDSRTHVVNHVKLLSLAQLTCDTLKKHTPQAKRANMVETAQFLERNIMSNLLELQRLFVTEESDRYPPGTVWRLDFDENQCIQLSPRTDQHGYRHNRGDDVYPASTTVIRDLLLPVVAVSENGSSVDCMTNLWMNTFHPFDSCNEQKTSR